MSRDNSTYKETYNRALDQLAKLELGATLPTEAELSLAWGTSRTTVRAVLTKLNSAGLVKWAGRDKTVLRAPHQEDYFSTAETTSTSQRVETQFMEYILGGDLKPGAILREAELVRAFGVSTSVIREFLIRFSRFGLIEKEPNRHWVLRGFTRNFAIELFDVRDLFERSAFERFLKRSADSDTHVALQALRAEHQRIADDIDGRYLDFPRLDEKFHRVWIDATENRFIGDFFELVSVIFHYHYRWNKVDERERNMVAITQHLAVIDAVASGDFDAARRGLDAHLTDARETLLASVAWDLHS